MQEISLQKRSFFNSIGLDLNNVPQELQLKAGNVQNKLSVKDLKFLESDDLSKYETKHFRLKNLVGTDNAGYDNQTWLDILINNEKSDNIIKQYFKNPNYYFKELRKLDQSDLVHNGEIELYEDNGKYFVKEGVGRLSLMMTKFLIEMSRAQTKEEKLLINNQYIFAAKIKSLPKDRDIIYLINLLSDIYGTKLKVERIEDEQEECHYNLKYGEKTFELKGKHELENFVKNSYLPKEFKSVDRLKARMQMFTKFGISYKDNKDNEEEFLVLEKLFQNYDSFIKYYKNIIKLGLEDKVYTIIDINNVTYEDILKAMIKVLKQEELNKQNNIYKNIEVNNIARNSSVTKNSSVGVSTSPIKSTVNTKVSNKVDLTLEAEKKKIEEEKKKLEIEKRKLEIEKLKAEQEKLKAEKEKIEKEKQEAIKAEKEKQAKEKEVEQEKIEKEKNRIEDEKKLINEMLDSIQENIELTHFNFKKEESKIMDLANGSNITLNIDRINDDTISKNVHSIKANIMKMRKKINNMDELKELKNYTVIMSDLKKMILDKTLLEQFKEEMQSIYNRCFNKALVKLITDSKIRKLDIEKEEIENEKCSFFSKLIGKAKLKQARLDNINLKKQLVLSESQYSDKIYYYMEDGLSEVYAYMKTEENEVCLSDIKLFLRNLESNLQIKELIDQDKLDRLTREKMEQQRNLPVLSLSKEKRKLFSKAQINLMEEKNNELKKVIQITRANSLKQQNTGVIPIIGNIKATKALGKYYNCLNEINLTLKYQCE